ncbi:MAG: hypothetical protein EOO07_05665 [Chitinophagaceae bacterium]|nr:MAG: hypothetical protein EOO07_05665 [Chitinophagaceae bacterium]
MIVTVVPIFDFEVQPAQPLKKVMTVRLQRLSEELQTIHLKDLEFVEPFLADVVIYLSYNPKYTVRWRIANDVPKEIEIVVGNVCARLNYIYWKTATLNIFKGGEGNS